VPGSRSLLPLGSRSLAPWPDPARRHGASPTPSPRPQQWLPGEQRCSRVAGGAPTPTEPNATPIPSLSRFPPLNPLCGSHQGRLSPSCASQLPGAGRGRAGTADPGALASSSPAKAGTQHSVLVDKQAKEPPPALRPCCPPSPRAVPQRGRGQRVATAGTLPWWGHCHPDPVQGGFAPAGPRVHLTWAAAAARRGSLGSASPGVSARGHGVTAQPWGWQGCGGTGCRVPLGQIGRERSQRDIPSLAPPTPDPPDPPPCPAQEPL